MKGFGKLRGPLLCRCALMGMLVVSCKPSRLLADDLTNHLRLVRTSAAVAQPPLPPITPSPVAIFRELLAMTPGERAQSLSNRPPAARQLIMAKVREYQSLKPDERELRLRTTELHWYLVPLLQSAPSNRTNLLVSVPVEDKKLIEDRLKKWDQLPADAQKKLLENEAALQYLAEAENSASRATNSMSAGRRRMLEAGIAQWRQLPDSQREQIMDRFNEYFVLTPAEQDRALLTLSDTERQQIDNTLRKFKNLSPSQRIACSQSFQKFTSLSVDERRQFLRKAEVWTLMKPEERQAWRDLVNQFIIMPPVGTPMPPMPMPPTNSFRPAHRQGASLATNDIER